jgi:AcrR family transcriptional regulator
VARFNICAVPAVRVAGRVSHMPAPLSRGGQGSMDGTTSLRDTVSACTHYVGNDDNTYTRLVPRLWNETIASHRKDVRDAILDTAAALAAEQGLLSVTMSQIAERTGIGRATLYKYFSDVESILLAWHERQITSHLQYLAQVRDEAGNESDQLAAVLEAYALISHESRRHRDSELAAFLHRDQQVAHAQRKVHDMIRDLLAEAVAKGVVRDDVPPQELATYSVHALTAANRLASRAAVGRLVAVTLAGLRPAQ